MTFDHRVAVIGAGVAGLSAARLLRARSELDVVVFEATDRPGGVIRTTHSDGFMREHAANSFISGTPGGAVELADELGVAMQEASAAAKRRWIYIRGELKSLPTNPLEAVTSDLISWRGKLVAALEPLRRSRKKAADESVYEFARRRLGDEVARTIVAPFVTGIFAGDAGQLSVGAGFPQLAELESRGGLVRGMVRTVRERRRQSAADGRPPTRPRMFAPIGGAQALVDALAEEVGDGIRYGLPIASIERDGKILVAHYPNGEFDRFDAVVLATPAYRASRMISGLLPDVAADLDTIPYASAVIVHLGYDRTDVGHPLDGFGFLVAAGESPRILGGVFESVLWPNRAPAGKVLLRCILGGTRDPGAIDLDDEELVRVARRDLRRVLDIHAEPTHINVTRWPKAIAQYTIGHAERVGRAERVCADAGIMLSGSAYHGVAVNTCTADATRIADRVLSYLSSLSALVVAFFLASVLIACAGNSKSSSNDKADDGGDIVSIAIDAGPTTPEGAAPPYLLAAVGADGVVAESGTIEATVSWLEAPAAMRASPGRNACGERRRAGVSIHTLGGVRGAVVTLTNVGAGRAPDAGALAELSLRDCRLGPAVLRAPRLGATLAVINDDERRHDVLVEHLGDGTAAPTLVARFSLPLVGHRVDVPLTTPGVVRARSAADLDDHSFIVVPATPYVGLTGEKGVATLEQVPAGTYTLSVWHPPVTKDGEPFVRTAEVVVVSGETVEVAVSFAE
jgi:oxygen-dependent protoporphyrinogen oxidase